MSNNSNVLQFPIKIKQTKDLSSLSFSEIMNESNKLLGALKKSHNFNPDEDEVLANVVAMRKELRQRMEQEALSMSESVKRIKKHLE